jgi:hypothetical protein
MRGRHLASTKWLLLLFICFSKYLSQGLNLEPGELFVALVCSHRAQQLPQLGRGDVESHCESLAHRLHTDSVKFIVFVPHISHNPDKIMYPFQSVIINTTAAPQKDPEAYFLDVKSILTATKPQPHIIWSFGDHPVQGLGSLGIPMLITISSFPRAHALQRGRRVRFRFFSDDSLKKWQVHNPWLSNEQSHIVVHDNVKEVSHMLRASIELMKGAKAAAAASASDNALPTTTESSSKSLTISERMSKSLEQTGVAAKSSSTEAEKSVSVVPSTETTSVLARSSRPGNTYLQEPMIIVGKGVAIKNTTTTANSLLFQTGFVVGTMTTTPKRLKEISGPFGQTLKNLLSFAQLDRLYLNVPWQYGVRQKSENVTLSNELLQMIESSRGKLRILRSVDYGPATKLLPTLLLPDSELPPNSMIITFDDDRIYTANAVKALVEHGVRRPDTVITIAAWPISILSANGKRGKRGGPNFQSRIPRGQEGVQYAKTGLVDLILGFYGVLYRKRFFTKPTLDLELFNYAAKEEFSKYCAWVDDIWFSGHLERLKIPKYTIGNVRDTRAGITSLSNVNALSLDQGESVKQNHDNVLCAEAMRNMYGIWGGSSSSNSNKPGLGKTAGGHRRRMLWDMVSSLNDYFHS